MKRTSASRGFLTALSRPFRGSDRGATLVEYIMVVGFCSLVAILAFYRYGRTLHSSLKEEARHIQGEGQASVSSALNQLGGATDPNGQCDVRTGLCINQGLCFAAGTPVATERGDRPIESIEPGDRVWARDVETGAVALQRVLRVFINTSAEVMDLELHSRAALDTELWSERLKVSPGHHFWVEGRGWVPAEDLQGQTLWSNDVAVVASSVPGVPETTTTYDLEVEEYQTYFVGSSRVLVHNQNQNPQYTCPPCCGPGTPGNAGPDAGAAPNPNELQCGQMGRYRDLPSSSQLQRDHVPSNRALQKRAEEIVFGVPLTKDQEKCLDKSFPELEDFLDDVGDSGYTIAIPNAVHRQTQTYTGFNTHKRQVRDAANLPQAARENMDHVLGLLPAECRTAYAAARDRILAMTQADYDREFRAIANSHLSEARILEMKGKLQQMEAMGGECPD